MYWCDVYLMLLLLLLFDMTSLLEDELAIGHMQCDVEL